MHKTAFQLIAATSGFTRWQGTRRWVNDLGAETGCGIAEGGGYVYRDGGFIETDSDGTHSVMIDRSGYAGTLIECEAPLFCHAFEEGVLDDFLDKDEQDRIADILNVCEAPPAEPLLPAGWVLLSADFSTRARTGKGLGTATLMRDREASARWHALPEAVHNYSQAPELYIYGTGESLNMAIRDAAIAALQARPIPESK